MKHLFKFVLPLLTLSNFYHDHAFSQQIIWQNTIGGSMADAINSIKSTTDGGFIIGGISESNISADKTENCQGYMDYWVVKLDNLGNIQWQNTLGGDTVDYLISINQTFDGGYICGGYSFSNLSGDKSENNNGKTDYWVVKLDINGSIEWQNTIGGSNEDLLSSIFQTGDGGYICGGWSNSNVSGDKTENSFNSFDYWLIKLDSIGNIEWQNTIGGSYGDYLHCVSKTIDGGYICGGNSASNISGDKTENCFNSFDYWVLKLDMNGNILWQNTIGGSNTDQLNYITQTSDGGYICGGYSESGISGDKNEVSHGFNDYWVVKLDSVGIIEWQNTIGGNMEDKLYSIIEASDGSFICVGHSNSNISGDKTENVIGNVQAEDYWIAKLNRNGSVIWEKTIGGNLGDYLYSVCEDSTGYILGGFSNSYISGNKTENSQGSYDFWVVKISNNANLIQGFLYCDLNSNNIKDFNETGIPNKIVFEQNTGRFSFTDADGWYSVALADSGSYNITSQLVSYYISSPLSQTVYFNSINQIDSINDFAFQPVGSFDDLEVSISPSCGFSPGFESSYIITCKNSGTNLASPTLIFYPDSNISFVSSSILPLIATSDSVLFTLNALAPLQSSQFSINIFVNTSTSIGTVVNSSVIALPLLGDVNASNNNSNWQSPVTGSFDPNDIVVDRDTLLESELPYSPFLEYIIHFQNTGNDTAFYVKIENVISQDLNINTIEFIASSHICNLEYKIYNNTLNFIFNNILLPDSNANEIESRGFVRYRIKPVVSIFAGDSILNDARIYFDFNDPILTNKARTNIVTSTTIGEFSLNPVFLSPNPVIDEFVVNFNCEKTQVLNIVLYNIYGQQLDVFFNGMIEPGFWSKKFDITDLESGIYFVEIKGDFRSVRKIIKL